MVGISECLIQAIVGKGLYEHHQQRQTARQVQSTVDLACTQRCIHWPHSQDPPCTLSLDTSSTSSIASDATKNLATDLSAHKSVSTTSRLKSKPTTISLGRSPLLKPIGPALIPDYNIVHNHCSRSTVNPESADQTIMESYQYGPLNTGPAIGFRPSTNRRRVRRPPRKITDLERLPSLSSKVAAEITRSVNVREQARILAEIREAREQEHEDQRRANRAAQIQVPPYVAHVLTSYSAEDLEEAAQSEPPPTPLMRPERKTLPTQPNQYRDPAGHQPGDESKQGHVRWGPEPAPRGRRESTVSENKGHRRRRINPRKESTKF
ncbi:hypothetical protein BDR22DRAFT_890006 [Usnea florida]